MAYDLQRAALIACCVFAIVVAASLFPATGYGDYPGSEAVDSGYYVSGGETIPDPPDEESNESEATDEENDSAAADGGEENESEPESEADDEPDDADQDDETDDESDDGTAAGGSGSGIFVGSIVSFVGLLFVVVAFGLIVGVFWIFTDPIRSPHVSADDIPSGFLPRLRLRLRLIPQLTMFATIGLSRVVPSVVDTLFRTTSGLGSGLASGFGFLARDVGRGLGTALVAVPSALVGGGSGLFSGLFSLSSGFSSLFGSVRSRTRSRGRSSSSDASRESETDDVDPVPDPDLGPQTIEEAWEEMVDELPIRRRHARTPGEYAAKAIDIGFPSRAVSQLTTVFRDVRYGGYPPSPDRTRRAREAFEEIESTRRGDDEQRSEGGDRP